MPRDWENLFVIAWVGYIENLHLTNFWENKQNVRYIEVLFYTFYCNFGRAEKKKLGRYTEDFVI